MRVSLFSGFIFDSFVRFGFSIFVFFSFLLHALYYYIIVVTYATQLLTLTYHACTMYMYIQVHRQTTGLYIGLKAVLDVIAPFLTELFNRSLPNGVVPEVFKAAYITPLLKKSDMDPEDGRSFRAAGGKPGSRHPCSATGSFLRFIWIGAAMVPNVPGRPASVRSNRILCIVPTLIVCDVPRGSVFGPILFLLYTADLIPLIQARDLLPHLYADDTHKYTGSVDRLRHWRCRTPSPTVLTM